jgi:hypothetical protein
MAKLENVKKGETVALLGFTGMNIGEFKVTAATKSEITIETKKGTLSFSRKTGKQLGLPEEKEKYANKIVLPEDAPEKVERKAKPAKKDDKKKPAKEDKKPAKKQPAPPVEPDDDAEDKALDSMTLEELLAYADEEEIDLSHLNKKQRKDQSKVLQAIKDAKDDDDDEEEEDDLDGILAGMTLTELFEYADENEVDLSQLNKKQKKDKGTVIDAIKEALEYGEYEEFDEC